MYKLEYLKIKDIGTVYSGTTPDTKNEVNFSGKINWYTPAEIDSTNIKYVESSERKITEEARRQKNIPLLPKDTVLLTSRAPIGKVAIAANECCTNQGFKNIVCDKGKVIPQYLAYWFGANNKYLNNLGRGATFKEISKKIVEDILVPIPPIQIQHKIVEVLNKCMELNHKRQSQITALDELTQSLFLEMFGDPVKNSLYPEIQLSELITRKSNNGIFVKNDMYSDEGNSEVIWLSDFLDKNAADISNLKKISVDESSITKFKVTYGDILFCRSSLTAKGIGKCAYIPEYDYSRNILFECHIIKLALNKERVIPEFVQAITKLDYFRNQIFKNSKTATMTTISQDGITSCKIICPPLEQQLDFKEKLELITKQKEKLEHSLEEIYTLYRSALQKAFKGDLFQD